MDFEMERKMYRSLYFLKNKKAFKNVIVLNNKKNHGRILLVNITLEIEPANPIQSILFRNIEKLTTFLT